jgi:hypothetical protein
MRGGTRTGAGRPKGAKGKKNPAVLLAIEAQGSTPRDLMLNAMWQYEKDKNIEMAVDIAVKVAPYVHPRLAASAMTVRRFSDMSDDELDAALSDLDLAIAEVGGAPRRRKRRAAPPKA